MRKYGLYRWNWSEKAKKWVYVRKNKVGRRVYMYRIAPPKQFVDINNQIKSLNIQLQEERDFQKNLRIFQRLIVLSQKMQSMRK